MPVNELIRKLETGTFASKNSPVMLVDKVSSYAGNKSTPRLVGYFGTLIEYDQTNGRDTVQLDPCWEMFKPSKYGNASMPNFNLYHPASNSHARRLVNLNNFVAWAAGMEEVIKLMQSMPEFKSYVPFVKLVRPPFLLDQYAETLPVPMKKTKTNLRILGI